MRLAIQQARQGQQTSGGAEVGAVLVRDGAVLCAGFNESEMRHDPTAHAEMVVIRRLCAELKTNSLEGYTLYCTLQPCGMCTMASIWSKVARIVYGAGREDVHKMYFEARHVDTLEFVANAYRDDLVIDGGILSDDCARLYYRPWDRVPKDQQGNI